MFVGKYQVSVGWGDCDPFNIVFYPNYFVWFDNAAWALLASAGFPRKTLVEKFNFAGIPLLDVKAKFIAPSRFQDELTVESHVSAWRGKTFEMTHRILNNGAVTVEGVELRAWCIPHPDDPQRAKATPAPQEVVARLSA